MSESPAGTSFVHLLLSYGATIRLTRRFSLLPSKWPSFALSREFSRNMHIRGNHVVLGLSESLFPVSWLPAHGSQDESRDNEAKREEEGDTRCRETDSHSYTNTEDEEREALLEDTQQAQNSQQTLPQPPTKRSSAKRVIKLLSCVKRICSFLFSSKNCV